MWFVKRVPYLVAALVIASMLILLSIGSAFAVPPKWFLTDTYIGSVIDGAVTLDMYEMVWGGITATPSSVTILPPTAGPGNATVWRSDQQTPLLAPFGAGKWQAKIGVVEPPCPQDNFHIYLGYVIENPPGTFQFTSVARDESVSKQGQSWNFSINAPYFEVPANGWLALKVVNETCADPLEVRTGGPNQSTLDPPLKPTYPVPEILTLGLFSAGIVTLGGLMMLKRRRENRVEL